MRKVIIVSPSLASVNNVSGVSAVTNYIINNNSYCEYLHFCQGKSDNDKGGVIRLKRILLAYKQWGRILIQHPDAIVHYNLPLDAYSILRDYPFLRKSVYRGYKTIIHIHGGLYLFKKRKPYYLRFILKKIFAWNTPIIVLSNKEKEKLENEYNVNHVYALPNCVDLKVASLYVRNIDVRRIHVLYLGRIEPNKGMDYLYAAAIKLKSSDMDFILHFAGKEQGKNQYIERFYQLLGDKFIYEGVVAGSNKEELFKKCDVFLLPSFYEGLPMSLLECMSYGIIPVTTNVGSIEDFVEDGKTGLFVKVKDVDSIVYALKRLYKDSTLRAKLSNGAREKIFSTLNPQEYISKLNWIYENG